MPDPLIGITTNRQTSSFGFPEFAVNEVYVQAVAQAGGIPVLVPLGLTAKQLRTLLSSLDGLLLSGGGDIESEKYAADSTPKVKHTDPDRDRVEIQLIQDAISTGAAFLGICRGIQVLNVALGGTLYTDIEDLHPNAIKHKYYPDWPRDLLAHEIEIQPNSILAQISSTDKMGVNSLHHQGIDRLAPDLRAIAHAPDGLIESVVLPGHFFGLAVQWHPEHLTAHASARALFRAFVAAAGKRER
ncbi:MAG: gamma-glutamyl-gamma-aminobutyrate hydrolase family protein [Chloroflexota bacterium]|nr:gamma-glutamyl-gamma-aminobutyrate hydrolase family protein [Chloroflexota bacterium]